MTPHPQPRNGSADDVAELFARHGPAYRAWAVLTVMLGTVAAVMEATIVNVALPQVIRAFGLGHDQVQLLSTGFLAATAISMLLSRWAMQRFGLSHTYMAASGLLMGFSVAACFAGSFTQVAACRIMQGVAAGILQPLAMVVIAQVFSPRQRGRAMSAYGLGIVFAPSVGPVAGGLLVDAFGWRAVFLVTVPFCLAAVLLARRFMAPGKAAGMPTPLDLPGLLLATTALLCLLGGLSTVLRTPLTGSAGILAGGVLCAAFVAWARRSEAPLLDPRLFKHAGFGATTLVSAAYGFGIYGSTYLVPVFAQQGAGFSAALAGAMLLPGGLALIIALLLAGRLADRYSAPGVATAGLLFFAASSLLLGIVTETAGFWWLALWIAIGRVGLGCVIPGLNASVLHLLPHHDEAGGAAAISFARQLGGTLSVTCLALFLEARQRMVPDASATDALQEGFLLIALIYIVALIPARRMAPPRHPD